MRVFTLVTLGCIHLLGNSFITPTEYATRLYHNPRGVGCHHCHGEDGKGTVVARYQHRNEVRTFEGPPIHKTAFEDFASALNSRVNGMPRYFLTDTEIKALYLYLHPEMIEEEKQSEANVTAP